MHAQAGNKLLFCSVQEYIVPFLLPYEEKHPPITDNYMYLCQGTLFIKSFTEAEVTCNIKEVLYAFFIGKIWAVTSIIIFQKIGPYNDE